jgi:SulP family sulfate permease
MPPSQAARLTPKIIVALREGYSAQMFVRDAVAGATVAVIALPLAMALGIASIPDSVSNQLREVHPWLTPPAMGLFTAVVAGFVISAFGGSRVQIGGPTAAFIPIVFSIAIEHGYEGLALATLMAGVIVVLLGVFRFGGLIKFIPYPVTTGFTAGIAVSIAISQLKDFLGLSIHDGTGNPASLPADFLPKLVLLARSLDTINWSAFAIGAGSLVLLLLLRHFAPRVPGAIVAVILAGVVARLFKLDAALGGPVETIGSRFGGIPHSLPLPHVPRFTLEMLPKLIAPATTIALLCAIESLLSAVVADGMTGFRHRSDQELVGQGLANIASAVFFGLPATGAIARTVANIKAGGRTPIAGVLHALFLLVFMFALAPWAKAIPMPALAAILLVVAWNIAEIDHFRTLLSAPRHDVLVLLTTFGLTVFTDLTLGVGVGMILASLLFMKRMAEVSHIAGIKVSLPSEEETEAPDPKDPGSVVEKAIPTGVEVFEINGPFFFGVADRLKDVLNQLEPPPKVFILRMRYVPHIDATGLHALEEFRLKCQRQGTHLLLGGVHAQPLFELVRAGMDKRIGLENIFENLDDALRRANEITHAPAAAGTSQPSEAGPSRRGT